MRLSEERTVADTKLTSRMRRCGSNFMRARRPSRFSLRRISKLVRRNGDGLRSSTSRAAYSVRLWERPHDAEQRLLAKLEKRSAPSLLPRSGLVQDFFCDVSCADKTPYFARRSGRRRYFLKIAANCSSVANRPSRMSAALCSSASRSSSDKRCTHLSSRPCFSLISASVPDAVDRAGSRRARVAFQEAMCTLLPAAGSRDCSDVKLKPCFAARAP